MFHGIMCMIEFIILIVKLYYNSWIIFDFSIFKQLYSVGLPSPLSLSSAIYGIVEISLAFVSAFCLSFAFTHHNFLWNIFTLDEWRPLFPPLSSWWYSLRSFSFLAWLIAKYISLRPTFFSWISTSIALSISVLAVFNILFISTVDLYLFRLAIIGWLVYLSLS